MRISSDDLLGPRFALSDFHVVLFPSLVDPQTSWVTDTVHYSELTYVSRKQ